MEPDNVTINCNELTEIAFLSCLHIKEFTLTAFFTFRAQPQPHRLMKKFRNHSTYKLLQDCKIMQALDKIYFYVGV